MRKLFVADGRIFGKALAARKKRLKAVGAVFLTALLALAALAGGCAEEFALPETEADFDFTVWIGNSIDPIFASSIADQFEQKTGWRARLAYSAENRSGTAELNRLIDTSDPVSAYFVSNEEEFESFREAGFVSDLREPFVWSVDGWGLAADTRLLSDLFGVDRLDALLPAMQDASYAEWEDFAGKLDGWIGGAAVDPAVFSGEVFPFAESKTELCAELNGVYALPGSELSYMGGRLMDSVLEEADPDAWDGAHGLSEGEAAQTLLPKMSAYVLGLEDYTSHLAGKFAAGIRGDSFVNSQYYSSAQAESIFMEGKAVFAILDAANDETLFLQNPEKAAGLVFLPLKMPPATPALMDLMEVDAEGRLAIGDFVDAETAAADDTDAESGENLDRADVAGAGGNEIGADAVGVGAAVGMADATTGGSDAAGAGAGVEENPADPAETPPANNSIVVVPQQMFCVNAAASPEKQAMAAAFLTELTTAAREAQGALQQSAAAYLDAGRVRAEVTRIEAVSDWIVDCYSGEDGIRAALADGNRTNEERAVFVLRLFREWRGEV